MANIFPPILDSQKESISSTPLENGLTIPFTMPSSTETDKIGHVQVLILRQSNSDSWSSRNSDSVPEQTTIYLNADCLTHIGSSLWTVLVPKDTIRGINSTNNSDVGDPGFPAGTSGEGETFTVQIRFGEELLWGDLDSFASWKADGVSNSSFGEWSNTQKFFVYSLGNLSSIDDLFTVEIKDDPLLGFNWGYSPISDDSLVSVTVSYSWTAPIEGLSLSESYINNFKTKELSIMYSGDNSSSAGEVDLSIMRLIGATVSISFLTANYTKYTWTQNIDTWQGWTLSTEGYKAALESQVLVGEELEDGVGSLKINWSWDSGEDPDKNAKVKIYRTDSTTFETVLIKEVEKENATEIETVIKDYSIEMGETYVYIPIMYSSTDKAVASIISIFPLIEPVWNPNDFQGSTKNFNFNGNSFLTDKDRQLRLQGNVTVSSFKINTSETFSTTIGSKYPTFQKSGAQEYRSLAIQSLVSIDFDTTNTFLSFVNNSSFFKDGLLISDGKTILTGEEFYPLADNSFNIKRVMDSSGGESLTASNIYGSRNTRGPSTVFGTHLSADPTSIREIKTDSERIYLERKFREEVMKWGSNGKPKIFRSETEGNMIGILSGVSFSPFRTNRHQYTLSGTFTEIAELSLANLVKYDLLPVSFSANYYINGSNDYIPTVEDENLTKTAEELFNYTKYP